MGETPGAPKNPAAVELGRRGARKRWGPHGRLVRLSELDPDTRAAVIALVEADQAAKSAAAIAEPAEVAGGER